MPNPSDPMMKASERTMSSATLPRNGTPKRNTPTRLTTTTSIRPMATYGRSFPSTTSTRLTGVDASCSMVPRSHSRAMVSEVSMAAMIIMITATSPGTIMFRLVSSSLYQTRLSSVTGGRKL